MESKGQKLIIHSEGTPATTKVWLNDLLLQHVHSVHLEFDPELGGIFATLKMPVHECFIKKPEPESPLVYGKQLIDVDEKQTPCPRCGDVTVVCKELLPGQEQTKCPLCARQLFALK